MNAATEPTSRWSALLSVLANWRDWNIPLKLAAVTLVPVVFAVVLGTMQISDQVDKAAAYRRVDRLVEVNEKLRDLVAALQNERSNASLLLVSRVPEVDRQLAEEHRGTDHARAASSVPAALRSACRAPTSPRSSSLTTTRRSTRR